MFAFPADTLYFFGDNNFTEWQSLFEHYESPPYVLPLTSGAYSFGIAGQRAADKRGMTDKIRRRKKNDLTGVV